MTPASSSPFREPPPHESRTTYATPRWLYAQVLAGIALGGLVGWLAPAIGVKLQFLGEAFIRLIRMVIAPIVFTTVVTGIAGARDLKRARRVGLKALLYFEAVSTVALAIGLLVVNVVRPGVGVHANPATLDTTAVTSEMHAAAHAGFAHFVLEVIPGNVVDAFARGDILQVLLFAALFAIAIARMGESGRPLLAGIERVSHALFGLVAFVMRLAPIGAFGAMAFTVGRYGPGALVNLGRLMGAFYLTAVLFVVVVLGSIARAAGISLWRLIRYFRDELLIVLGTSSSETVLPRVMEKLEELGCARDVVGLVVPTGYSFNLDGTSIYLSMAAIFVAQATDTPLDFTHQIGLMAVLLLTSKGAAAVTGGGFITLAATLSATHAVPVAGITLLLGVDRFMSECRALTNLVGNTVATIVIARWEKSFDAERAQAVLGLRPKPGSASVESP